ncbi:hypothetical protein BDV95DRAFT_20147 [Massariosphaeria phaeospora]|uniref:Uncharacterized protein n=1 Tax=Massariosphaeria phaeospora TaxID=100035 RepID=A0A7C8IIZ1_9PLEO|nr:hypothetical protein BDV95DRAFT_20147 [Massariosphaeria phaeospora]
MLIFSSVLPPSPLLLALSCSYDPFVGGVASCIGLAVLFPICFVRSVTELVSAAELIVLSVTSATPEYEENEPSSRRVTPESSASRGMSSAGGGGGGGGGAADGIESVLDLFGDPKLPSSSLFRFSSAVNEPVGDTPCVLRSSLSLRARRSSSKSISPEFGSPCGVVGVAASRALPSVDFLPPLAALSFSRSAFFLTALSMKSFTKFFTVFWCLEDNFSVGSLTRPDL